MKDFRTIIPLVITFFLILSSCANSSYMKTIEKDTSKEVKLNYSVKKIEIYDQRPIISDMDIKLPFISTPNQLITNYPPVDSTLQNLIKTTILEKTDENTPEIDINVSIVKAYKEFSATFWSETEKAFVEIQLDIIDTSETPSFLCSSHAEFFIKSGDAKTKRLESLYRNAYKAAIVDCINKLNSEK
jgi:hypothetical protein